MLVTTPENGIDNEEEFNPFVGVVILAVGLGQGLVYTKLIVLESEPQLVVAETTIVFEPSLRFKPAMYI